MKNTRYLALLLILLGSGCSQVANETPTITLAEASRGVVTETPVVSTSTQDPVPSVSPTIGVEFSSTPIQELATVTPVPKEILDQVYWLFKDNGGCQFPCWWEIVPGQTTLEEAVNLFEPIILSWNEYTNYADRDGIKYYIFAFYFPVEDEWNIQTSFLLSVREKDNVIESISTNMDAHHIGLHYLPEILSQYGKPESILVNGSAGGGGYFMNLYMYYPQHGFLSTHQFRVENGEKKMGSTEICSALQTYSGLMLWDPDSNVSINMLSEMWPGYWYGDFLPLEQVSKLSMDEFYNAFTEWQYQCIEIDTDFWFSTGN